MPGAAVRVVLLDLDGTLYRSGKVIDGAVVAAVEFAAGVKARVLGKPAPDFFLLAAASLAAGVEECVVVGDDATTDIAGGRATGMRTVQVRTGKYADQRVEGLTGSADHELDSVAALPALLRTMNTSSLPPAPRPV